MMYKIRKERKLTQGFGNRGRKAFCKVCGRYLAAAQAVKEKEGGEIGLKNKDSKVDEDRRTAWWGSGRLGVGKQFIYDEQKLNKRQGMSLGGRRQVKKIGILQVKL